MANVNTYFLVGHSYRTFRRSLESLDVGHVLLHGLRGVAVSERALPESPHYQVAFTERGDVFQSLGLPWVRRNALEDALARHTGKASLEEQAKAVELYFKARRELGEARVLLERCRRLEHEAAERCIVVNGKATIFDPETSVPYDPSVAGHRLHYQERKEERNGQ